MTEEQQEICEKGRVGLSSLKIQATYQWLDNKSIPSAACENTVRCESSRDGLLEEILHHLNARKVLGEWQRRWTGMLCRECEGIARLNYARERESLWDALPRLFELPCWEELRREQLTKVGVQLCGVQLLTQC